MPKISAELVEKMRVPSSVRDTGHKDAVKGFGVRAYKPSKLHPAGERVFFLAYQTPAGDQRWYRIGSHPTWTVTAARARAKEVRQQVDRGEDPMQVKKEIRTAPRVRDLIDRYVRDHLPRTAAGQDARRTRDVHRQLAEIASHLGEHRLVTDIHIGDVQHLHETITKSGRPIRANRVLALCSKMFSLSLRPLAGEARSWRGSELGNPCKHVAKNPESGRERFFSQQELAAISDALAAYGNGDSAAASCLKFCMLTGCRPGSEAAKARWEEFDQPGFWNKPSAHLKQRRRHSVPLNPAAQELIERLRKRRGRSPWVFPGKPASEPLRDYSNCWEAVCERAGIRGARAYDLRHSFASLGAGSGLSLLVIGKLLGHTQAKTTLRYSHLADDPLREATDRIGAVITGNGNGNNVTPIRGRRS
jgi:integrase